MLAAFAGQDQPLDFAGLDHAWYARFREFFHEGTWGSSVNTFGRHVRHLKSFLAWAEDRELPVSRKYRKFEAPDEYIGTDALAQAELLRLAAVDVATEAARARSRASSSASRSPKPASTASFPSSTTTCFAPWLWSGSTPPCACPPACP